MSTRRISSRRLENDMIVALLFPVVLIVVIIWFAKSAGEVGGNQITWSMIGAASFGVTVLLLTEATKLYVKASGGMGAANYRLMGGMVFIAVIAGVAVCYYVHKALLSKQSNS